jgi:hypothetical protein
VKWVVVTEASFDAWVATTDPMRDRGLRDAVLSWVIGLVDGPPGLGIHDPWAGAWFAQVGDTNVWIRYLVLPDLVDPAIVIREYL